MAIHDLYIEQMKRNTARNTTRRAAVIDQFPDIETEWRHFISRIEHLMRW